MANTRDAIEGKVSSASKKRSIHGLPLIALLGALMLTLLLEALDQTIVGTALPKIIASLQGFDRYTWVATAYLLASTTVIPIVSKLSDQFGRKGFFIAGVLIFLLGSLLSGIASNMNQLIIFRAVQGLGAGMGIALVFTAVGDIFPPAERSRWQGIFAAVYGFSSVVGPTLGGWLSDHGPLLGDLVTDATRWRWIFYVNLPVGVVALLALLRFYPLAAFNSSQRREGSAVLRRIDIPGACLAAMATVCLLLGLTWGGNQIYAWTSPQVIIILVAAVVFFVLFIVIERFVPEPILPLHLFRNQLFAADSVLSVALGMILLSLVIYLPLYLQGVLGESATNSGEVVTPLTISLVVGSALTGIVMARIGRYHILAIIGAILACIGTFLLTRLDGSSSLLTATIAMIVVGIGLGMFFPLLTLIAQNGVPRRFMGVSTGAITYLRSLGQTLGLAIVGTIVNHTVASGLQLPASASELSAQARTFATNPEVLIDPTFRETVVRTATYFAQKVAIAKASVGIPAGPQHDQLVAKASQVAAAQATQHEQLILLQIFAALKQALTLALNNGFWCILIFCVIAFIATLFLKDVPLSKEFVDEEGAVH